MAKHIVQEKYLSGTNIVFASEKFVYCFYVNLYYTKEQRYEQINIKYLKSKKPIKFKTTYKVYKLSKELIKIVDIDWIGAPYNYIITNKFKKYEQLSN